MGRQLRLKLKSCVVQRREWHTVRDANQKPPRTRLHHRAIFTFDGGLVVKSGRISTALANELIARGAVLYDKEHDH